MLIKEEILHKFRETRSPVYSHDQVMKAMDFFAEQQCDLTYNLFKNPLKELEPLEDLWREENSSDKFVIPDMTIFCKWIVDFVATKLNDLNILSGYKEQAFELKEINKKLKEENEKLRAIKDCSHVPYQCCPLCNGNGQTVSDGFTSSVYQTCKVCNGARIIPMHIVDWRFTVKA